MSLEEKVREEDGVTKNVLQEAKLTFIHASLKAKIKGQAKIVCVSSVC